MFDLELVLKIEGNRAIIIGSPGKALLPLSMRLEGSKRWLKTGAFSFEATPGNLERFRAVFPGARIEAPETASPEARNPVSGRLGLARTPYSQKTAPYPFQDRALGLSGTVSVYALLGEMGTGKSKVLIDTAGLLWSLGLIDAVVIIALKGVHAQWIEEQFPEHLGESVPWQGAAITRSKEIPIWDRNKLAVLSVNFDYAKSVKGFDNVLAFIKSYLGRVLFIVDESHEIKNASSKVTEHVTYLGKACAYRRIATGTPIGKNLVDALSQYSFLDEAILGHRYLTSFKAEYCNLGGFNGKDVIGHKNVEQFWSRVDAHTFRITKEEADLGLPPKVYDRFQFELSSDQRHHYDALKRDMLTMIEESGEMLTVKTAVSLLVRLQQVACGFLVIPGDKENGIPDRIQPLENARMDALDKVMSQREGKMVVWARFNYDIEVIERHLGASCVSYYGPTSAKQRIIAKEKYLDPGSGVRVLVASPAAGGTGLNLQGDCRTVIYYSNSFDAIDRWQSEDRVHRIGMKFPVTYFDLVARKTIDLKLLANLRAKKSISDLAFDDIRKIVS